ncbi:MAG: hypothetical protein WBD55_05960 [Dehalococcoidia bacterium]
MDSTRTNMLKLLVGVSWQVVLRAPNVPQSATVSPVVSIEMERLGLGGPAEPERPGSS